MEEVRMEEYEGRERQTTRFFHSEQEREELPFVVKAGMGIAAAAGVLAVGHRTGSIRKIAQFLDSEGKASIQAFREVRDRQGKLFTGDDKLTAQRMKELKESFVDRKRDIGIDLKRMQSQKNILSSREFRMEKELDRRKRIIGERKGYGDYTGELSYNIQEGYRFAAIMDDMRKTDLMRNQPKAMDKLEKALTKGDLGILDWGSKEQLEYLLKNNGKGVDDKDVLNVLEDVRSKYKGKDIGPQRDAAYRTIEGMQQRVTEETAKLLNNAVKENNKFKSTIIGHRQATVGDILELNKAGKIKVNPDLKAQINDVMKYNKDFGEAVFDESLYVSTKNGELFDYNTFKQTGRRTAEWWANTLPGGLLHLRDILNVKTAREQASMKIFQRGTVLSSLNGHMGKEASESLNEEVLYMYGKFVRVNDVDALESNAALNIINKNRDMYLTSSQFGTMGKMHRHMSGLMTDNESPRNIVSEVTDVGRQDKDSVGTQAVSMFTKFFKKDWERNRIKKAINNGLDTPEEFFELNTYFKLNTRGYTPRILNNLESQMPNSLKDFIQSNDINFSRDEDITKLFRHIGEKEVDRKNSPHTDLQKLYRQFNRNPEGVLNRKTPVGESNPILGDYTRIRSGQDEINQQVSLYLTHEIMESQAKATTKNVVMDMAGVYRQNLKNLYKDGKIFRDDLEQGEQLLNYAMFRSQGASIFDAKNQTLNNINHLFQDNKDFQNSMRSMARKTNPMWERYSSRRPENLVGDEYIAINESNIGGVFNQMFGINSNVKERAQAAGDLWKQISPFTGRRNMEDVSTLTLFGNYYPVYRLQDALGNIGLGFSDASMGNSFQMFNALMWKRIFPIYAGVEGFQYADYKVDQWTGEGITERWENYKANQRLDDAANRTPQDIYEATKTRQLRPGIEHWEAMPEFHLPGVGPVGAGDLLNNVFALSPTFDKVTLREEDLMTYDETMEDLYYGTEEIRKGRWWAMGSKSAYRGDRIIEFAPNSFRQAHSDWEYTDTIGSGEEQWTNSFWPTFENWFGLKHLLGKTNPYWFEEKHYYDRPYMLTGELFNPNTMILGDIGNATIGRLIKPVKEMHPEYWGDPVLIYENETSELGERPATPIRTEISPAGRVGHDVLATPDQYGSSNLQRVRIVEEGGEEIRVMNPDMLTNPGGSSDYVMTLEMDEEGNPTGGYVATKLSTNENIYVPSNVARDYTISEAFYQAQADAPSGSEVKTVSIATDNPSYQTQVSTQPRAMFDEEYAYRQEIMYRQMANIRDPRDGSWRMQEGIENWTEPLGVYKWIIGDEILGNDPYAGQMVVQRADAAYNASNRFWESELGSLGSQLSEIGRRFIRRDSGQLEQYNPIKNEMPSWLPGENYFINFQTGDPYSLIPNGEYRLPGEAYESLNELHSDDTGRYGAFDKFKILADVAPWSDEYNFWSQYLLDNLEDGDLRKQATEIRRQVSQRKQKYEFEPYRFKGNEVVYEEVTVSKFLDDYTFLTEELGDQPIRIAGMEYRKDAGGVLQNYFQEGDTVTIGIAEDPTQRISKDTYGTMRAVIFNELGNINQDIINRGRMVENMNDFSAPGIQARFTPQQIKQGERWETVAHASSPLNTKFLQVRTAVEEYERDQIYGRDWATWENFMLDDYIIPTIQGLGRFDNPLWSMTAGATTGLVLGRFFLKGGRTTKIATITGALFGLGSNMFFKNYEEKHGEAWIPENRRTEHEINEYFDILKFLKYEGLYQKAREEIVHQTGYDIEDFARVIDDQKELTKQKRSELEEERKQLYLEQPKGWEERRKEINKELETISQNFEDMYLPEAFLQALNYKEERDTTLYAVDPYSDRMKVMQAFPYKDKWFFSEFAEANMEDRERILELVPENQRRIYKAMWGMELEEQKPLEYYAEKYNIPDWDWEGWKPEYSLDDIKAEVVQKEGLDLSDFNFWEDDLIAAQYTPDLPGGNEYIAPDPPSNFKGFQALRQNLANILNGTGLYDVKVTVTPSDGTESQVNIKYTEDRREEIEEHLRLYGERYV